MRLRIHLAVADPAVRQRLVKALRTDPEVVLVAEPDEADLVIDAAPHTDSGPVSGPAVAEGPLTARELEVLRLMAQGLGNKEIGRVLGVSSHTAKFHVASVLTKLGVHSRTEAVSAGIRNGLVPL
jgi:DNA-binding CsgD family transcriptional regulator